VVVDARCGWRGRALRCQELGGAVTFIFLQRIAWGRCTSNYKNPLGYERVLVGVLSVSKASIYKSEKEATRRVYPKYPPARDKAKDPQTKSLQKGQTEAQR
jgi:hypothetical protein